MPGLVNRAALDDAHAVMATNHDDTIIVDASSIAAAPRVKRVKTEHINGRDTPRIPSSDSVGWLPPEQHAVPVGPSESTTSAPNSHNKPATHEAEPTTSSPLLRKIKTPSLRLRLSQGMHQDSQSPRQPQAIAPRVVEFDIQTAPTDPREFVWWLAQHVTAIQPPNSLNGGDALPAFDAMTSIMRPLSAQPNGIDDDPSIVKEKEREKQRVENRERKKRWREINAERNKDNDLRCRVTKLAKAKFGSEDSEAKTAFIEREFETRRAKRAEKEKRNASYRGTLSAFRTGSNTSKDLKENLRAVFKGSGRGELEWVGGQLADILVDIAGQQLSESSLRAAQSLREDLNNGATVPGDVEEAARILMANDELRHALEGGGTEGQESVEPESISDDEEDHVNMNGHWTKDTTPALVPEPPDGELASKLTDPAGNLTLAVQTLNGMSRAKASTHLPKSSRGPLAATRGRGRAGGHGRGKKPHRSRRQPSIVTKALETSSIDALLKLANGGSIMANFDDDTDDEDTIPDSDDFAASDLNFLDATADGALNDLLERVATRIVRERLEREGFERPEESSLSFDVEAFRTHAVREQVLRLKTFLSEAGVSVNTLMPLAQAQALSELYAHLRKYIERESSPVQEEASSFLSLSGSTIAKKGKEKVRNGGLAVTNGSPSRSAFPPAASSHRSADEQRMIHSWGFPALPGQSFDSSLGKK